MMSKIAIQNAGAVAIGIIFGKLNLSLYKDGLNIPNLTLLICTILIWVGFIEVLKKD